MDEKPKSNDKPWLPWRWTEVDWFVVALLTLVAMSCAPAHPWWPILKDVLEYIGLWK